ncbi:Cas9 inhibitor AcrIIA9 family protein [Enterococcus hirae]
MKEIKTIKDLKIELQQYDADLMLSIFDEETGYSDIDWFKEKGTKQNVWYQWLKLASNHSLHLQTIEQFVKKMAQYPEQMIVTMRNTEGKYSRLFLVVEKLEGQQWVMIVDDLTYRTYYKQIESDNKTQALEKMLEEMEKEHSDTEDCIHSWLCTQEDDQLFQGILKKDRTIKGAVAYCLSQAKKQAGKTQSAMVPNEVVFSWVREYFLLAKVEVPLIQGTIQSSKPKLKKANGKKEKVVDGQVSLFDEV